jgi:hypothetical protein
MLIWFTAHLITTKFGKNLLCGYELYVIIIEKSISNEVGVDESGYLNYCLKKNLMVKFKTSLMMTWDN